MARLATISSSKKNNYIKNFGIVLSLVILGYFCSLGVEMVINAVDARHASFLAKSLEVFAASIAVAVTAAMVIILLIVLLTT